MKTVMVSVKLFPATGKKVTEHTSRKGAFVLSNSTRTLQMAPKHLICPYLRTDMSSDSVVYNLTTV